MNKITVLMVLTSLAGLTCAANDITIAQPADLPAAPEKNNMALFIDGLNTALELEYAAAIQYIQHAAVITGPQYADIAKELTKHAKEELAHATQVADLINYVGGTPSVNVAERLTATEPHKMLEQDLRGEQIAIDGYKKLIKQATDLGEYGIAHVLSGILSTEEEHEHDISRALCR